LVVGQRYKFNQHSKFQPYVQAPFGGAYTTSGTQIFAAVAGPLIAVNPKRRPDVFGIEGTSRSSR
jgi:hypothetical protein